MVAKKSIMLLLRTAFLICFVLMIISSLASCFWLLFAAMALAWPIPRLYLYEMCFLLAQILSLVTYFKWPWVAVLVSWIDMAMILLRVVPWTYKSLHAFIYQCMFDLLFFAAAHVGLIVFLFLKRSRTVETI